MYFWSYRLRKTWLDKCLKSLISKEPLRSNMLNGSKHSWNLNNSTLTSFIDHWESNSIGKSLSYWDAKYYACLVTHWLRMTSILFLIETIYSNTFRWIISETETFFSLFLYFGNSDSIWKSFKKRMTLIADAFSNLRAPKKVVR